MKPPPPARLRAMTDTAVNFIVGFGGAIVAIAGTFAIEAWKLGRERRRTLIVLGSEADRIAEILLIHDTSPGDRYNYRPKIAYPKLHRLVEGMIVNGADVSEHVVSSFLKLDGKLQILALNAEPTYKLWEEWHDQMKLRNLPGAFPFGEEPEEISSREYQRLEQQMNVMLDDLDQLNKEAFAALVEVKRALGAPESELRRLGPRRIIHARGDVPVRS